MFLLSALSRTASGPSSNKLWVRAFTSTTSQAVFNPRRSSSGLITAAASERDNHNAYSTTSSSWKMAGVQVEEDLDSALDDLLKSTFDDDSDEFVNNIKKSTPINSNPLMKERQVKDSKPLPIRLVKEDDPTDFKDPKFLSTSNPRWIEAGLDQRVIDVLSEKGIVRFTPVQGEAFDPIVAGRDIIGRSRTGTGKTLAFGLPSIIRIVSLLEKKGLRDPQTGRMTRGRPVSMLILCPTRELARQVQEELADVARPMGLFTEVFHGGVSYDNQSRALRDGLDILVGTPGRIIDHINRGNLKLSACDLVVLDEADEMLSMGFAEDVEVILDGSGADNGKKPQVMLFSATTPPWVKQIGRQYQEDVLAIDATADDDGARVAKTVRHTAVRVPPGVESKRAILEDIIAIEISKDMKGIEELNAEARAVKDDDDEDDEPVNEIAAAAAAKRKNTSNAMQQRIFGKTIVFVETKREADELVSGGVFKSLSAQALHGDVGQKQRDATLAAFRAGAFNVLVATDVAARGIDVKNVDLVVQFDPPRDVDTYVHRSGRTGRAGSSGVSVLLFGPRQEHDIVRIERDLGHGFQFELCGPPSIESALRAAAKTSAVASRSIPDETSQFFKEAAASLLKEDDAEDVVARCLAAISRRSTEVNSRSLITGEIGMATVEMSNSRGRPVSPGDVMFTVSKLSRMSRQEGDLIFENEIGKIQANPDTGVANFDMSVEDAKKLVEFSKSVDAGGAVFSILNEIEIERDHNFGRMGRGGGGGRFDNNRRAGGGGGGYRGDNRREGYQGRPSGIAGSGSFRRESRFSSHDQRGAQRNDRNGNDRNSYSRRDDNNSSRGGGGGYSRSSGGGVYSKAAGGRRFSDNSGGNDGW